MGSLSPTPRPRPTSEAILQPGMHCTALQASALCILIPTAQASKHASERGLILICAYALVLLTIGASIVEVCHLHGAWSMLLLRCQRLQLLGPSICLSQPLQTPPHPLKPGSTHVIPPRPSPHPTLTLHHHHYPSRPSPTLYHPPPPHTPAHPSLIRGCMGGWHGVFGVQLGGICGGARGGAHARAGPAVPPGHLPAAQQCCP